MTIFQRKKRIDELNKQIESLMNCRGDVVIKAGRTVYHTNIRNHKSRRQALENAVRARYKHQKMLEKQLAQEQGGEQNAQSSEG